jgi:hypothetical protein
VTDARARLVLGLGSLHHLGSPAARRRLIAAAFDAGIRDFDVAPAYGNGVAERELGRALRALGARDVRVSTKVGMPVRIYPPWLAGHALPLARAVDIATGGHGAAYARRTYRPADIREGLDASLRRLRLECVHCCYLHEPLRPFGAGELEEIGATFEELRRRGKIARWGIAGPIARYQTGGRPQAWEVQQPIDEWLATPLESRAPRATLYGLHRSWRRKPSTQPFEEFLRELLRQYPDIRLIVASTRQHRVTTLARGGRSG